MRNTASPSPPSVRAHHAAGKPILAECGGMMALVDSLETVAGQGFPMIGLIPGKVIMQKRLAAIGMQKVALSGSNAALRGHTFHYSRFESELQPFTRATRTNGGEGEAVFRIGNLTASYFHAYFASSPEAAATLFSRR